jgi:phospholipid N-methyltransferase
MAHRQGFKLEPSEAVNRATLQVSIMKAIDFVKVALKDYKVGALTKSSKYTVRAITNKVRPGHKLVVEYGAGDGVITRELLSRLPADAQVVAVELNKEFLDLLGGIKDDRLLVKGEDVLKLSESFSGSGIGQADAVISGIPFSFFSPATRAKIVRNTQRNLREGGVFIVYQYSPLMLPVLKKYFRRVTMTLEMRNMFPYFIMVAEK